MKASLPPRPASPPRRRGADRARALGGVPFGGRGGGRPRGPRTAPGGAPGGRPAAGRAGDREPPRRPSDRDQGPGRDVRRPLDRQRDQQEVRQAPPPARLGPHRSHRPPSHGRRRPHRRDRERPGPQRGDVLAAGGRERSEGGGSGGAGGTEIKRKRRTAGGASGSSRGALARLKEGELAVLGRWPGGEGVSLRVSDNRWVSPIPTPTHTLTPVPSPTRTHTHPGEGRHHRYEFDAAAGPEGRRSDHSRNPACPRRSRCGRFRPRFWRSLAIVNPPPSGQRELRSLTPL